MTRELAAHILCMRSSTPFLPPRVPAGQFTFKQQSHPDPETTLVPGALVETGMKTQIWPSDPELVSVSRSRLKTRSMLVDIAEYGHVAINVHLNRLDSDEFVANLNIRRFDGRIRATAVFDALDFSMVEHGRDSDTYLSDRRAAIDRYLRVTYGLDSNGCSEWDNITLIRQLDVTHLAQKERRWMTVETTSVIAEIWHDNERLEDFREHVRNGSFLPLLRSHLDSLR